MHLDLSGINLRDQAEQIINSVSLACESGQSQLLSIHLSNNEMSRSTQEYILKKLRIDTSDLFKERFWDLEEFEHLELQSKAAKENHVQTLVHELFKTGESKSIRDKEVSMIKSDLAKSFIEDTRQTNSLHTYGAVGTSNVW